VLRLYVICVALVACSDREADKLAKVRDQICACKTVACAEAALKRVPKHDAESTQRAQRLAREMLDCLAEVYHANEPTLDPDAPAGSQSPPSQ
jgi:hypothetical protein